MTLGKNDPATTKQIGYINVLLGDREVEPTLREQIVKKVSADTPMPWRDASVIIGTLKFLPRANQPENKQAEPGYYYRGDTAYVVVWNKDKTHTYAKRLVVTDDGDRKRIRWVYTPGAGVVLSELKPLTVAELSRLSAMHEVCIICGRRLTDPKSAQRSIGPVCIKKVDPSYKIVGTMKSRGTRIKK